MKYGIVSVLKNFKAIVLVILLYIEVWSRDFLKDLME